MNFSKFLLFVLCLACSMGGCITDSDTKPDAGPDAGPDADVDGGVPLWSTTLISQTGSILGTREDYRCTRVKLTQDLDIKGFRLGCSS